MRFIDTVPLFPQCRRQSTLPIRLALHHCSSSGRGREDLSDVAYEEGTPHTIPRTTVIHLLQSNVDLNMIHSWLGVSDDEISDYRIGAGLQQLFPLHFCTQNRR